MTAVCGIGAINDDKYFKNNCKTIIENRDFTINGLKSLGFTVTESKANFVFAKSDKISRKDLYLKLKEAGILVRHFEKERIKDYVRITIGSHSQMKTLLKEIKNLLEKI
jgi:histidinol-phosphate aminotransferase